MTPTPEQKNSDVEFTDSGIAAGSAAQLEFIVSQLREFEKACEDASLIDEMKYRFERLFPRGPRTPTKPSEDKSTSDKDALEQAYFTSCLQLVKTPTKYTLKDYTWHITYTDYLYDGNDDDRDPREFVADLEWRICRVGGSTINEQLALDVLLHSTQPDVWEYIEPDDMKTYLGAVRSLFSEYAIPEIWDFKLITRLTNGVTNVAELANEMKLMRSLKSDVKFNAIISLLRFQPDCSFFSVGNQTAWECKPYLNLRQAFEALEREGELDLLIEENPASHQDLYIRRALHKRYNTCQYCKPPRNFSGVPPIARVYHDGELEEVVGAAALSLALLEKFDSDESDSESN